jgi:hypothetical protein
LIECSTRLNHVRGAATVARQFVDPFFDYTSVEQWLQQQENRDDVDKKGPTGPQRIAQPPKASGARRTLLAASRLLPVDRI